MSKLQPLLLDNGQIILVATTPNVIDTSALQQAEPPTPTAEEAMDLPEPTRTFIPPDENPSCSKRRAINSASHAGA